MAVTKIWSIKGRAGDPLSYATDPEKTGRDFTDEQKQALADVIAYAANEDKTEQLFYTTGINCSVDIARDQFDTVKLRYGKTGGNVAYHAYQSFREGEVTPDEAHEIGVQLARELWGDRFQIVVATHVNTSCVHNHIVLNSVSFKDGKKFHNCSDVYRQLRATSDRICKERGLSIVDIPKGKAVSQYLYKMEKAGKFTRYNVARRAIDEAIEVSLNLEEFKAELRNRGYLYKLRPDIKYWTITPPGGRKSIRIHQLGDNYTRESIEKRIYENDPAVRETRIRRRQSRGSNYNLRRRIDRIMGLTGLERDYLRLCYEMGILPKYRQDPTRVHYLLKDDLLKCDQYSEQAKLISKYHIHTDRDLADHVESTEDRLAKVMLLRIELRKKSRRVLPEAELDKTKDEIKALTAEARKLRRELKVCEQIDERSESIRQKLELIDRDRGREERRR